MTIPPAHCRPRRLRGYCQVEADGRFRCPAWRVHDGLEPSILGVDRRAFRQLDCEHDLPACRGQSVTPVGAGEWCLTLNLTDLRSSLLICRSSPAGNSYGSQLTGFVRTPPSRSSASRARSRPSSGMTTGRHRLNRGGLRHANAALLSSRHRPHAIPPTNPRLRRPTHRRWPDQTRDHPMPETLPCARDLPTRHDRLPHTPSRHPGRLKRVSLTYRGVSASLNA